MERSLKESADKIHAADEASDHPEQAVTPLLQALDALDKLVDRIEQTDIGPEKTQILDILHQKQKQCETAANLAANISVLATIARPQGPESPIPNEHDAVSAISPGQTIPI